MSTTKNALTITTPSDLEIVMTREFDAPRSLVFEVFTQPEHVKKWWHGNCTTMTVCEIDLRVGGAYRFVAVAEDGSEHPFIGVYREIVPPERLVNTVIYDVDPWRDSEAVVTVIFEDLGERTRMVQTIRHASKTARDGHLNSGMEYGAARALDLLEAAAQELGA